MNDRRFISRIHKRMRFAGRDNGYATGTDIPGFVFNLKSNPPGDDVEDFKLVLVEVQWGALSRSHNFFEYGDSPVGFLCGDNTGDIQFFHGIVQALIFADLFQLGGGFSFDLVETVSKRLSRHMDNVSPFSRERAGVVDSGYWKGAFISIQRLSKATPTASRENEANHQTAMTIPHVRTSRCSWL